MSPCPPKTKALTSSTETSNSFDKKYLSLAPSLRMGQKMVKKKCSWGVYHGVTFYKEKH